MSATPPFALVTGSAGKLAEARRLCSSDLEVVVLDLPEIQSLDLGEILTAKGEEAWRRLGRPLVVEEAGLELAALNGFPGPLVKWMLAATGPAGIARIAHALGDAQARARCLLLYRDAERSLIAEGATDGTLVDAPRGDNGFGWDSIFLPEGNDRTFGELTGPDKDAVSHRGKAWRNLLAILPPPQICL
ncbi:MAG: non-canonical purine NTP pyrophosphatase [Thermoanaerobaculia bacterium]